MTLPLPTGPTRIILPAIALWVLAPFTTGELIGEGVRDYDFMEGDARHKRDWGGAPRPAETVAFALPRLRARLEYGLRAFLDRRRAAGG